VNDHNCASHSPDLPGRNLVFVDDLFFGAFMRDRLSFRSCDCTSREVDDAGLLGALWHGQSQVPEFSGIELTVLRELINPCGVPGWAGTKERHTTMNVDAISTDNSTALHATRMAVRASGAVTDMADSLADSALADNQPTGVWNRTAFRHIYPYALFNKSPLQLRRIGALGGKSYGRNQRARRALMPTPPALTPPGAAPRQSTAEDVAVLDAQFPWLSGAERRRSRKQPSRRLPAHSPHCGKRSE
jgi:hypothetical protein